MAADEGTSSRRKPSRRQPPAVVARAAVSAALEQGYDRVTVEMICSLADISRSTFFNHFPSRDAAIIGKPLTVPGPEVTHPILSQYPEDLVRGLLEMQVPGLAHRTADADVLRDRTRLITEQPAAMSQYSTGLISVQNNLSDAVEGWLRANPQHARLPGKPRTEAVLAVTSGYAALFAASQWWSIPLRDLPEPLAACLAAADALRNVVGVNDPSLGESVPCVPKPKPADDSARPPGLRERKRRDTEKRIELAAVRGALERGFEAVTVDEICEKAVISRSTFFNYFPSRDAAIVGRPMNVLPQEAANEVLSRHGRDSAAGAIALIFGSLRPADPEVAKLRAELSRRQPAARDAGTTTLVDAGTRIMATIRDWLSANPQYSSIDADPAYEASLAANAAYAAVSVMADGWLGAAADVQASAKEFTVAMADLRTVLSSPAA
ncbi:TetR family transcriptional regulator [Arthrobacter gandavensis]|uniref:TetR/AcrR family transcriptional regulator n=1 Tax=Arthrobacter gandavensis TaxID=169960 RepID=UPI00188FB72A|nr:TetR/AcrR family transcriptional regulator [Arthrobacter gandavensis]MBF4995247.1 TetR family transcriptional regulator [Arthrobacter gandavensis]